MIELFLDYGLYCIRRGILVPKVKYFISSTLFLRCSRTRKLCCCHQTLDFLVTGCSTLLDILKIYVNFYFYREYWNSTGILPGLLEISW